MLTPPNPENMKNDFTITLSVDQSREKVFEAITNVRAWWAGLYYESIEGRTEKMNDEFTFRAGGGMHYSKQKLIEVVPNQKVVWLITDSDLSFLEHRSEWTGTKVIFEISSEEGKTALTFTHQGLTPAVECYEMCAPTWSQYLLEKLVPLLQNESK